MPNSLQPVVTRFRAYQLGVNGSSFSYFAGNHFTLIEGMATESNRAQLIEELLLCGKTTVDTLHITSWDQDHCSVAGLEWILKNLSPNRIEAPGYEPHTDCGETCKEIIVNYQKKWVSKGHSVTVRRIDPHFIKSLEAAQPLGYRDIFYHPKQFFSDPNNNSTVKFFRRGAFNVLSLGDVMDPSIGSFLRACKTLCREVDIMILAHHGADNGFTTKKFLEILKPTLAICSSDYGNKFDHPRQEIKDLLWEQSIPLFTTKTGDVVIETIGGHTMDYRVTNMRGNNADVSSIKTYRSRKSALLRLGADTVKNVLHPGYRGYRR